MKSGRRTDCTPEVTLAIADNIRSGLSNRDSALLVGVSESSLYGWLARARAELARVEDNPRSRIRKKEQPFLDFLEAIERAIPQRKNLLIQRVQNASMGGNQYTETKTKYDKKGNVVEEIKVIKEAAPEWTASAWLLERLHPDEFGRRLQAEIGGRPDRPIQTETTLQFANTSDDELLDALTGAMGQIIAPPERKTDGDRDGSGTAAAGADTGSAEVS